MRQVFSASIGLWFCVSLCHAQAANTDRALLEEVRGKYDAPFLRGLQSFDCAVEFSWKDHFKETTRVGDEGTDSELEKIFQPIRTRVRVTQQDVTVSSGMTDEAEARLPHGGMAEGLLKHAVQKSLGTWLPASSNSILPDPSIPVTIARSAGGYKLGFSAQGSTVEMALLPDMRLQSAALLGPQPDRFDTVFAPGPQGFVLSSWTMAEDGNKSPGHRLIFSYSYQTVEGFRLPESVSMVRESHHEVWRYRLSGCVVKGKK